MVESTKQVKKVVLRDNVLKNIIHAELYKVFRERLNSAYEEREKNFFSDKWILFSLNGEKGCWNREKKYALPVQSKYGELKDKYFDISCVKLTASDVETLFGKDCPAELMNGIKSSNSFENGHWVGFDRGSYCVETGRFSNWNDDDSVQIGAVSISRDNFKKSILSGKYEVINNDIFKNAVSLLKERNITDTGNKTTIISEQEVDTLLEILKLDRKEIEKEVTDRVMNNFTMSTDIISLYTEGLLSSDKSRADLEKYDSKCLEDVNSGHWELWSEKEPEAGENQALVELEKPLIARNPTTDIHEDGLIGIDFGTKSTIVSRQDGREKTSLIRVGIGQLTKAAEAYHYENPTIMEFRNLKKFLDDYETRNGRPETSIEDLRVSHAANNDLKSCKVSDAFYSYFYDIKQWCGDTERNVKIIDQTGTEQVLPAFVNLKQDEFNPLELYAYYLGLYINNMRNGIFLDYILSFPVTYEKSVKEKILESFTKGLKKSLPESILSDESIMTKFRVRQGVSEPAAYAITALQGYGFEPEYEENVLYSIFDFGGGTTDFDFGLWRLADDTKRDEERYDYVIEHFGSEGDKYLGGENLLELLAFEVFKANAALLGRNVIKKDPNKEEDKDKDKEKEKVTAGFSFSKPKECDDFPGSETLISDSQEARRNTKQLMEALRPFWEGIIGIADKKENSEGETENNETIEYGGYIFRNDEKCKFPINNGEIQVDLFDKDGKRIQNSKLYIQSKEKNIDINLIEILEKRIERGVSNFFTAIVLAFRNESAKNSGVNGIQIFLAGNSSKSPILRKIFEKYIEEANKNSDTNAPDGGFYHLFPPLGTDKAREIQKQRNVKISNDDLSAPTGKTGVAYGLIAGREGGSIKVISEIKADEQAKFRYNVGVSRRGKFTVKLDRNKVSYGQWIRFIDAGVEDFEIYYTSLPAASKMSVDDQGVYKKRCRLTVTDADKDIYIRCTENSPEDIEYCVSKNEVPDENTEIIRVHLGE